MKKKLKRFLPILIILIGMGSLYYFGMYHYLTFDNMRAYHVTLQKFVVEHPIGLPILYILSFIVLTVLSVPGSIFLTILGGYLFIQPLSTLYVILAGTIGASLIFLAARTALGDFLKKKKSPLLNKMREGFNNNATNYMLFLRLVPFFPFWIVNLVPAFFKIRFKIFFWTTLIGMAPATFVFTLAGRGLEQIFETHQKLSMNTLFNTQLKIALVLLGILSLIPIFIKRHRNKRASK